MKKSLLSIFTTCLCFGAFGQQLTWVSTTRAEHWKPMSLVQGAPDATATNVVIHTDSTRQQITGFGGCFNELGWQSLQLLSADDRKTIFTELFSPHTGGNFTICRMPVGANDFADSWYSYDEKPGDFSLSSFNIARDERALIPFIKTAQLYNPVLKLWASPWSPPTWMKTNGKYAAGMVPSPEVIAKYKASGVSMTGVDFSRVENGLKPGETGREGMDLFIQKDQYFSAYARYFGRFIDAYRTQGIPVSMVMPQNEFNSAQVFPSCTWTAQGLARFIGYLGPEMKQRGVAVFFGTVERANEKLVDSVLTDPQSSKYISGAGFQWAGKGAIAGIHRRYPDLALYQSEQECGDGQNDWKYCRYTWELMKHYFNSGANAYLYWNIALKQGGISHWGWSQNSLVSVDTVNRTYTFNHEYYLLKHLSHFIQPGAHALAVSGTNTNLLAFRNPDKSIVIVIQNPDNVAKHASLQVGRELINPLLPADSFNTFVMGGTN